jgi:hypothetical protein
MSVMSDCPANLSEIRHRPSRLVFPTDLLPEQRTALLLFCAGFYGRNDGIHVWDAGIRQVIGVDSDELKLQVMANLYPGWLFIGADVYAWADGARARALLSDIVIVDCQVNQSERCYELIPDWCSLANNVVVLGTQPETIQAHGLQTLRSELTPEGWHITRLTKRNDAGSHWLTLQRKTTREDDR